ncbi:MAG TPA: YciI family protein [Chloroflexota bacterium]
MKYVFLLCNTRDDLQAWEGMPEETRNAIYGRINQWFAENQSVITGGYELQPPSTATTLQFSGNGAPMVTDGPYVEANEIVGGYAEVELPDLDAALRLAKTWPGGGLVEIRPVVTR